MCSSALCYSCYAQASYSRCCSGKNSTVVWNTEAAGSVYTQVCFKKLRESWLCWKNTEQKQAGEHWRGSRGVWCSERNWKFSSTNGLCSIYHLEGGWPLMPLMKCLCQKRNSSYHFAESTHSSSPFSFYCYCVLKSFTDQAFIKLRVPRLILNAVKIRVESASLVRLSGLYKSTSLMQIATEVIFLFCQFFYGCNLIWFPQLHSLGVIFGHRSHSSVSLQLPLETHRIFPHISVVLPQNPTSRIWWLNWEKIFCA